MKKNKIIRRGVQLLALGLTITGLIINQSITTTILLAITLFAGAYYCGYVCPFGFIQDLVSDIGNKLAIKKYKMPKSIDRLLSFGRYIIFALVILSGSSLVFQLLGYDARSNFSLLLSGEMISIIALGVLFFFIIVSLFFERAFCKYLCYTGAQYGLLSLTRVFTIKRNETNCVDCKKCDKVCPMNIEISTKNQLRSPQCINCFDCVNACPKKDTLTYGLMNFKLESKKKKVILAIVVILISLVSLKLVFPDEHSDSHGGRNSEETIVNQTTNSIFAGELEGLLDGTYSGSGDGFKGKVNVEVTIESNIITAVKVVSHNDDFFWFYRANASIPSQIVEKQSTDVDLVSGATYSSAGIQAAVVDALNNAVE